jgi:hypothetical protein
VGTRHQWLASSSLSPGTHTALAHHTAAPGPHRCCSCSPPTCAELAHGEHPVRNRVRVAGELLSEPGHPHSHGTITAAPANPSP